MAVRVKRPGISLILLIGLAASVGLSPGQGPAAARAQGGVPSGTGGSAGGDRREDRAAIRAALDSFAKAFASRDAKALGALWTSGGEFTNVDGLTVRGRDALEAAFARVLAESSEPRARVEPLSLRFLANDAAIEEGKVVVRRGAAEPEVRANYSALLLREDGRWRLAELSETAADEASVGDLAWLVGEWSSTSGQGAEIRTTYAWNSGKTFLHSRFTIREKGGELSGSQVIGVDPSTGALHGWTFEADGGVGEADWTPDGDHWILSAVGTLADGRTLSETNILRRVDDDTFTWQSVDRLLGDAALPDLAPVKVTRVKPAK